MHWKTLRKMGLLLCCFSFCPHLQAQTDQHCIVVETTAGQKMEYLLTDLPRIVHGDATVTLTTVNTIVEFQTSEVVKVYVAPSTTGIANDAKTAMGQMKLSGDFVVLTGYAPNEPVSLYATDGKQLKRLTTDRQGGLVISLSQLNAGIYIIKTKQQSIKFTKK